MSAPRRLLEDPSASAALRDDLRTAAEAEPRYDSQRGLFALQAAVATLGPAVPIGEAASHAGSGASASVAPAAAKAGGAIAASGGKLTIAALATAVGLGVAGVASWKSQPPAEPPAQRAPVAAPMIAKALAPVLAPAAAPVAAPVEPASAPTPTAAAPEPLAPAAPHASAMRASAAGHGPAAAVDPDLALRREIEHLARVKALMERDPRGAFELAQSGNRTLSSMYRQERDGLSVVALHAAGEHEAAVALAHKFLRRYPKSPLRERVAAIASEAAAAP